MAYFLMLDQEACEDTYVEAVDGLLIATQYDVPWREDLFHHFDFYDVSESFEMRKAGYKILVPHQSVPWVIHDSSFAKLNFYDEARRIALEEYPDYFNAKSRYVFEYDAEWDQLCDALAVQVKCLMSSNQWREAAAILAQYRAGKRKNSELERLCQMSDIWEQEQQMEVPCSFFDGMSDWQEIYARYTRVRFLMRRMELGLPEDAYRPLVEEIKADTVSCAALFVIILHGTVDKAVCLRKLVEYYIQSGNKDSKQRAAALYQAVKDKPIPVSHLKHK